MKTARDIIFFIFASQNKKLFNNSNMKKSLLFLLISFVGMMLSAQVTDTVVSKLPTNKNVIIEEYTGVNCGYCPIAHRIVNELMASHPGRLWGINIHTGGYATQFQTSFGSALANQVGLSGYPAGTVNRHVFSGTTTDDDYTAWGSHSNIILSQTSPVNIAAFGTLDYATRQLSLTVQLYYTANSDVSTNMLNVAILQNNVLGPQTDYGNYNPDQWIGDQYNHMHMLRHLITGQWGETIETTTEGTFVQKTYTYTIPAQFGITNQKVDAILDDLDFICFVAEGHQEILTGVEAEITRLNLPANNARPVMLVDNHSGGCDELASASIMVKNNGSATITSLEGRYKVGGGNYENFTWQGNIPSGETGTVTLPEFPVTVNSAQTVYASLTSVNGDNITTQEVSGKVTKYFYWVWGPMYFKLKTDRFASETSFKIFGPNGDVVLEDGGFQDLSSNGTTLHEYEFIAPEVGCYTLEVYDTGGDGINSGYGSGNFRLYRSDGISLWFSNNGKFGSFARYNFFVSATTGVEEQIQDVKVYPSPVSSILHVESTQPVLRADIYNIQGQMVRSLKGDIHSVSVSDLSSGIYTLKLITDQGVVVKKIVKE